MYRRDELNDFALRSGLRRKPTLYSSYDNLLSDKNYNNFDYRTYDDSQLYSNRRNALSGNGLNYPHLRNPGLYDKPNQMLRNTILESKKKMEQPMTSLPGMRRDLSTLAKNLREKELSNDSKFMELWSRNRRIANGVKPVENKEKDNYIYGSNLVKVVKSKEKGKENIPLLVVYACNYIEKNSIDLKDLYEVKCDSSSTEGVVQTINQFRQKSVISDKRTDKKYGYVLACVLKSFFNQLKQPIISKDVAKELLKGINTNENVKSKLYSLKKINYDILAFVIRHLSRVSKSPRNNTTPGALANEWVSCLFPKTGEIIKRENAKILKHIIFNCDYIFTKK